MTKCKKKNRVNAKNLLEKLRRYTPTKVKKRRKRRKKRKGNPRVIPERSQSGPKESASILNGLSEN